MAIISIFNGDYCQADEISEDVAAGLGYTLLTEKALIDSAAEKYGVSSDKLQKAMYGAPSFLNNITHEKEKHSAYLQETTALMLQNDNIVFNGFASLFIPENISHVLRVFIIASREHRTEFAIKNHGLSEREADKLVRKNENACTRWAHYLTGKAAWDESLYDIIIPMQSTTKEDAVRLISDNAAKDALKTTDESRKAMADFAAASQLKSELIKNDHSVDVVSENGELNIYLMKYSMRFDSYKKELEELAGSVTGVSNINVKYHHSVSLPSMTRRVDIDIPSKVLLVDDEIEYVHTLSERLKTRQFDSSIVYDGEEALDVVNEEEPDVMILDLKMPGIDGIEVLRKVKKTNPNIEVIIVTGHGSVKEKELATELGAFAYLEKPVDIEVLTQAMQEAYKKVESRKQDPDIE